jgi:hypothetical protein
MERFSDFLEKMSQFFQAPLGQRVRTGTPERCEYLYLLSWLVAIFGHQKIISTCSAVRVKNGYLHHWFCIKFFSKMYLFYWVAITFLSLSPSLSLSLSLR